MDAAVKQRLVARGLIRPRAGGAGAGRAERPSREEAEAAVRTLIAYAGDDPKREGLLETPKRVVDAYEELYRGYREVPGRGARPHLQRDRRL